MISAWTQHLSDNEEKGKFIQGLQGSRWLLDRLGQILIDLESGLDKQELSPKVYDLPNWENRQAHANGFRQCLQKIQTLINLDQKDTNGLTTAGRPSAPS